MIYGVQIINNYKIIFYIMVTYKNCKIKITCIINLDIYILPIGKIYLNNQQK